MKMMILLLFPVRRSAGQRRHLIAIYHSFPRPCSGHYISASHRKAWLRLSVHLCHRAKPHRVKFPKPAARCLHGRQANIPKRLFVHIALDPLPWFIYLKDIYTRVVLDRYTS